MCSNEGEACPRGEDCVTGVCADEICQAPACDDGVPNGDETDVDCGGRCPGCDYCGVCADDGDCRGRLCESRRCGYTTEVYVDWLDDCQPEFPPVTVPDVPAGTYRVTALESAGTVWAPPWSPPTRGWFYEIDCPGFSVPATLGTPPGTRYATAAEAFDNLETTTATATWSGGDLECRRYDPSCLDDDGGVRFRIDLQCP